MAVRNRCGICVAQVSVMRPVAGSNAACAPRASIGVAFCRRERSVDADTAMRARHRRIEIRGGETALDHDVAGKPVMDARRIRLQRILGLDHRGQGVDLNVNRVGEVFRLSGRGGDNGCDRFADETHDIRGEERLLDRLIIEFVQHGLDRPRALQVGRAKHPRIARRLDCGDAARGDRAADEAHPVCCRQIGREPPASGHQRRVFKPPDGAADPFCS